MNTFRRNDLLKISLNHYSKCSCVEAIQVIWSDQNNRPTIDESDKEYSGKVKYEMHDKNSLSNRFFPKLTITTLAVLSTDDDLLIPCDQLSFALSVWKSNSK